MKHVVKTYYLEMTHPAAIRPASAHGPALDVRCAELPCPPLNRFLYTTVGQAWQWTDRLPWTDAQWAAFVDRPELQTWLGYARGTPVGYFELERQGGDVEIISFGLLPQFIGQGFGGQLLTAAITQAWNHDAARVWLHTCSLDGPAALPNYQARGFRVYKTETAEQVIARGNLEQHTTADSGTA